VSEAWDTCGRWPDEHAPDCEWFRVHNLPEAKRWTMASWAAHPHRLHSNPTLAAEAERECPTCHPGELIKAIER